MRSASRMLLRVIFAKEGSQSEKPARGGAASLWPARIAKEMIHLLRGQLSFLLVDDWPMLLCITAHVLTWKDCKKELK